MKYWENGLPSQGVEVSANDGGTLKYWSDGLPLVYYFISGVSDSNVDDNDTITITENITQTLDLANIIPSEALTISESITQDLALANVVPNESLSVSESVTPDNQLGDIDPSIHFKATIEIV